MAPGLWKDVFPAFNLADNAGSSIQGNENTIIKKKATYTSYPKPIATGAQIGATEDVRLDKVLSIYRTAEDSKVVSGESARDATAGAVVADSLGNNGAVFITDVPAPKVRADQPRRYGDDSGAIYVPMCLNIAVLFTIAPVSEPDITGGNVDN